LTPRARRARNAAPVWCDLVIGRLIDRGAVAGTDRLVLAGQDAAPAPADIHARGLIEDALRRAGLTPPDASGLASTTPIPPADLDRALRALIKDKRVVRLGDLLFHADALGALKSAVAARAASTRAQGDTPRVDVADFKRDHGLSRKFAIPLLEWLDRERVTRRVGEGRIVL
jgi:selenocysteine-specific elongation factor